MSVFCPCSRALRVRGAVPATECRMPSATGRPRCVEQVDRLEDRVPVRPVGRRADGARTDLILDLEDGLPGGDERIERRALAELLALLVDREVKVRQQLADLREVVLETDRQALRMGEVRERGVEE